MSPVAAPAASASSAAPAASASSATQADGDLLEHPDQAFSAYRAEGVAEVVCEEKHMGSRAVLLVCRSPQDAAARFGVSLLPRLPAPSGPGPAVRSFRPR